MKSTAFIRIHRKYLKVTLHVILISTSVTAPHKYDDVHYSDKGIAA